MVSATLAADGAARDLHDLRQIQAPCDHLRLIVSTARVDQRAEFLRIAGRTSGGLADERVRLPDQPFDLLRTASSFEHVGHEGVDDPPSLPEFQIGPAPPVLLDLQVDAEL